MMKQFLLYLFCISITLQSVIGQFMFYDHSTDTFYTSIPSFFSDKKQDARFHHTTNITQQERLHNRKVYVNKVENVVELPKFIRDSVVEHLFSPSSCPEAGHTFIFFSYLFLGHCFDLFVIEEKINNLVHSYAAFFRNIEIGLPATKLIYPYHNFY